MNRYSSTAARVGRSMLHWLLATIILLAAVAPAHAAKPAPQAGPAATPSPCSPSQAFPLPSGAKGLVCVPSQGWNNDVIVFAHGYVAPGPDLVFANLEVPGAGSLPEQLQTFGYAFAATTYRRNGLAIREGVEDVRELVAALPAKLGREPNRVFVLGVSEGGIIATLFAERYPQALDGALALCGPIGDFKRQITYFGDFRVLFDYYFPQVDLPGDAATIPPELIRDWESVYAPRVAQALALPENSEATRKLIEQSGAAIDLAQPTSAVSTTLGLLWYNVFSTNDAKAQLGGNPYDSAALIARTNLALPRYTADSAAVAALAAYETTGRVAVPLITVHTTGDEIIPFWHQDLYRAKAAAQDFRVTSFTGPRYGHCRFTEAELFPAFLTMTSQGANIRRLYLPIGVR